MCTSTNGKRPQFFQGSTVACVEHPPARTVHSIRVVVRSPSRALQLSNLKAEKRLAMREKRHTPSLSIRKEVQAQHVVCYTRGDGAEAQRRCVLTRW